MVAWLAVLRTPECPKGRELVIICNDITFQAGSFGTKEDAIFFKVM
jgi:acetyl-CoA carboxylase/biotin carboxylase 1